VNYYQRIYKKAYYELANRIIQKRVILPPSSLKETINVFIYFDYEREFGGHSTMISDRDIYDILTILDEVNIRTTWFTVGKIYEKYRESVDAIISRGHEIGSHTYNHTPPLRTTNKALISDFKMFEKAFGKTMESYGFHAPNGEWSIMAMKQYSRYGISFDIASCSKSIVEHPSIITLGAQIRFVRLYTIGDDWQFYGKNCTEDHVLETLIFRTNQLERGDIIGMGFHPWVIFSDSAILNGVIRFFKHLKSVQNIRIETAGSFVDALSSQISK
jgi:peptidoglycan-N-acetylglucosamine deacetylase